METDCRQLAAELMDLLKLGSPPLAITFSDEAPADVPLFDEAPLSASTQGRIGRVAAGCVFWMKAAERTFTTVAEDHGNCSVGSVTHGLKTLEEAAGGDDIAALVAAEWVSPEVFPTLPRIAWRPAFITYGPLRDSTVAPDVVFLRVNAKQVMALHDALPELCFEGKPQCHIIPLAKEQKAVAVSVGCMLSRVRTGMPNHEMTCAIPAERLHEVVNRLRRAMDADTAVAAFASADAGRFR